MAALPDAGDALPGGKVAVVTRDPGAAPPGEVNPPAMIDALLAPLWADARRDLLDRAAIDELRPFGGIRIEDDILVEAAGTRNLTREAFAAA